MNEQAMSLFTYESQVLHRFLNPWIIRVAKVIEHHEGPLSEHWTPRFNLIYGAFPVVCAIDVQQLNHPAVSWALIARSAHEGKPPPGSWTHQPQIQLTLRPVHRIITLHCPPWIRQEQRYSRPRGPGSKLDNPSTSACGVQQYR
ncbi:MAG: hypothetical protein WAU77_09800 [Solirubrobacteraceae bacterium]